MSSQIEKMQAARMAKRESGEATFFSNPIDKWEASDKKSRSLAIAANCASCQGCAAGVMEPGFKIHIRECTIHDCSLHGFRPYK